MTIALAFSFNLMAQVNVSGVVTEESGFGLPGVSVVVQGTTMGVLTDMNGSYSISVPSSSSVLEFSFIGYSTQQVTVGTQNTINVVLSEDIQMLDEVVVTGYMTQRKADLTGSVSVVQLDQLSERITSSPLTALQGAVAGLYIESSGNPSGATSQLLIRGVNTLGNTSPLYIIDGVPTTDASVFNYMDPNSIASMQVLKDAAAASIYGSRASNGVIIVTTKKGASGDFKVSINSSVTVSQHTRRVQYTNAEEQGIVLFRAAANNLTNPQSAIEGLSARYTYDYHIEDGKYILDKVHSAPYIGGDPTMPAADTDWQDAIYRTGVSNKNNVTISGGTDKSKLHLSFGRQHNKGIVIYNWFKNINGQINSSTDLFKGKVTVGEDFSIAHTTEAPLSGDHNGPGIANFGSSSVISNASQQPRLPIYTTTGEYAGPLGSGFSDRNNPVHIADMHQNNRIKQLMLFGNAYLTIKPIDNLSFTSRIGLDYNNSNRVAYEPIWTEGFLSRTTNLMEKQFNTSFTWTWSNTLQYTLKLGENTFDMMAGAEAIKYNYSTTFGRKEKFASDLIDYMEFDAGTGAVTLTGSGTGYSLLSYFGKVNYSYSNRYLASVTLRADGSSRFGTNNKWGFFPAATLGWRINNEAFMEDVTWISNLKLRAGYGIVGNQQIGDIATYRIYESVYTRNSANTEVGSTSYDIYGNGTGSLPSGYVRTQMDNDDLKWESTTEYNVGIDFGFLEERIYGSFDYFFRQTEDILTRPPVAGTLGEGAQKYINGATMENKGYEFNIGYRGRAGKWSYDIAYNMSGFNDKITYLPEEVISSYAGNGEKTIIGQSTKAIFGYLTTGIFQTQEEALAYKAAHGQPGAAIGRLIWADLNNDGKINALDQDWLGTSLPKFEYGLNVNVSYADLSLTIFGQGVYDKTVRDTHSSTDFASGVGMNFGKRTLQAWSPDNASSTIPALSLTDTNSETSRTSNYQYSRGDYFKIKTITLSYNVPRSFLSKINVESLRIYGSVENAILIRKKAEGFYSGPDPETPGSVYPKPISMTVGLNITF